MNTDAAQRSRGGPFLGAFILLTLFYTWTCLSDGQAWGWGRPQTDHYNLLVHGFLDGHLHLKAEVPRALLECPDPYDPALRPEGAALHDASLYQGHYYIYHGVAPALCLLLPFRALSGIDLPLGAAVLVFSVAALLPLLALAESLRRRFFPACGPLVAFCLLCSLGLLTWAPVLLRRYSLYDLPIASGQFFGLSAFYALHRVLVSRERRVWWLALASLCWGLAVASRPTYLLAALVLLAPLLWFRNDSQSGSWRGLRWSLVCAALLPVALIGLGLALYNQLRFGDPLEFGVRYILSGVYESRVQHFALRYLPWNLGAYFWAPVSWSGYFPFLGFSVIEGSRPLQHYGMDIAFGLLRQLPLLWFVVVIPLVFAFRSPHAGASKLRRLLLCLAWVFFTVAAFLLCFYAAMLRYVGDFGPWLGLLAVVGAMAWVDGFARRGRPFVGAVPVLASCGVSALLVLLLSLEAYGRLSQYNHILYSKIGDLANRPAYLLASLRSQPTSGALLLAVRFPAGREAGVEERLLADTGGSRLSLRHLGGGQACFVFVRNGMPERAGSVFSLEPGRTRSLRLALGCLYAPFGRPELRGLSPADRRRLERTVVVQLDGRTVLWLDRGTGDGIASGLYSGAGAFTGQVLALSREPVGGSLPEPPAEASGSQPRVRTPDAGGWVRFAACFPRGVPGRREPLLVSGDTGRGDFLLVEYVSESRLRLIYDHWGRSPYLGPEVSFEPGREHLLEVRHPAPVLDSEDRQRSPGGPLQVRMDGVELWSTEVKAYPAQSDDFYLGDNPIGGSSCGERFSGELR